MLEGQIININSNQYKVLCNDKEFICSARGKFRNDKITPMVGDYVLIDKQNNQIIKILPRKNFLLRPNVANVDIALIITSVKKPNLDLYLLDKLLTIIVLNKIKPIICFTKIDLLNEKELINFKKIRNYYEKIYDVIDNNQIEIFKQKVKNNIVAVYKVNDTVNMDNYKYLDDLLNSNKCEKISIYQKNLQNNWLILNDEDRIIYEKIQEKSKYILEDIAVSFQGIITGCDKAFILNEDDDRINYIDNKFLKSWIKNRNINQYVVEESRQKLIYSNDIKDIDKYPYIVKECLMPYEKKLKNRRECIKSTRKWYELQWGREKSLFERKKIMYPYKSTNNRFAIDENNNFSSADVYSFYIKKEYEKVVSYEYIIALLNSEIYDRYFKMIGKCMGNKVYDYYPNKVMKLRIFKDCNYDEIEALSKKIIFIKKQIEKLRNNIKLQGKKHILNKEIYYLENESHFLQNKINELIKESLTI